MGNIPAWIDGVLQPVDKLEVHRRGLRHKAISVFVFRGDDVLIQRRAMGKYHTPGLWANTCCSHPHWDEDAMPCAKRRLGEELGIHDLPLTRRTHVEYRADVGGGLIEHEVVDVFSARVSQRLPIAPNPAEVMATAWVGMRELVHRVRRQPQIFTPWLRTYLERDVLAEFTQATIVS